MSELHLVLALVIFTTAMGWVWIVRQFALARVREATARLRQVDQNQWHSLKY